MKKYNPSYKIYKPGHKDHSKGSATSWEYNQNTKNFFLTIAKQNQEKDSGGNPSFSWKENSETVKLDLEELAEIILVFSAKKNHLGNPDGTTQKGKGLFHQTKDGNTILKIYQIDTSGELSFGLEISSKKESGAFWSGQRITLTEAKVISILCEKAIAESIFQ
jgi:hypothetical protein